MEGSDAATSYSDFAPPLLPLPALAAILLIALPVIAYLGYRTGRIEFVRKGYDRNKPGSIPGETTLGGILVLVGLLLAFSFSTALGWSKERKKALVEEATAIGTAFLRADLVADPGRTELQRRLLQYARSRQVLPQGSWTKAEFDAWLAGSLTTQAVLWPATRNAIGGDMPAPLRTFVSAGVTDVLDAHTRRLAVASESIPIVAKVMLFVVIVAAIFVAGNNSALLGRPLTWRTFVLSGLIAAVMIIILDIDRSREGLILIKTDAMQATIRDMEAYIIQRSQ